MILLVGSSSGIGNKLLQYLLKFDDVFATYYKKKIKYSQKKKVINFLLENWIFQKKKILKTLF